MASGKKALVVQILADVKSVKKALRETQKSVITTAASMDRITKSFDGDKLLAKANATTAGIDKIGGASRLTAKEQQKVNRQITEALAKYKALGRTAPAAMVQLAKDTAKAEQRTSRLGTFLKNNTLLFKRMAQVGIAAVSAAFIGAIKAASDFESSFAGVRKTVTATEPEFARLAQGMRDLSTEIPVSVDALNRIGESAGQLGIETENILGFTRVMADLGATTNLSADQAATSLARLANITGLPQSEFDRLGSTIVDLGNNFATTEAEIVDFGLRIAASGRLAGLSEAQILGIGSAMSSVGVQAEAGGTAVQKVLNQMTEAVATTNESLEVFARTAGLSAEQFATAFRDDAGEAFTLFVEGIDRAGDGAFKILDDLNVGNERVIRSFTSVANAGDLLRRNIDTGTEAFRRNTALAEEAEKRYSTFASQMTLLKNAVIDVGISFGEALLPDLALSVKEITVWLTQLSKSQEFATFAAEAAFLLRESMRLLAPAVGVVNFFFEQYVAMLERSRTSTTAFMLLWHKLTFGVFKSAPEDVNHLTESHLELNRQLNRNNVMLLKHKQRLEEAADKQKDLAVGLGDVATVMRDTVPLAAGLGAEFETLLPEGIEDRSADMSTQMRRLKSELEQIGEGFLGVVPTMQDVSVEALNASNGVMELADSFEQAKVEAIDFEEEAKTLGDVLRDTASDLNNVFRAAFEGGGGLGGAIQSLMTGLTEDLLNFIPVIGPAIAQFGGAIVSGFSRVFRALTGGPSEAELEAREMVSAFTNEVIAQLNEGQLAEAQQAIADGWANANDAALVIGVRDAAVAMGRTAAEGEAAVQRLWDAIKDGGPNAVQAAVDEIDRITGGVINLAEIADQRFGDMEAAAQRYGIELDALGSEFLQHELDTAAQQIIKDFELLQAGGANVDAVLAGMSDEISDLVQDSLKFGTEIPANMRPLIEQLIASGDLIDANGQKISDLDDIQFATTLTQGFQSIVTKLDELIGRISGVDSGIKNLPKKVDIKVKFKSSGFPSIPSTNDIDESGLPGASTGTHGRFIDFGAGTPVMLHGRERIVTEAEGRAETVSTARLESELQGLRRDMATRDAALPFAIFRAARDGALLNV